MNSYLEKALTEALESTTEAYNQAETEADKAMYEILLSGPNAEAWSAVQWELTVYNARTAAWAAARALHLARNDSPEALEAAQREANTMRARENPHHKRGRINFTTDSYGDGWSDNVTEAEALQVAASMGEHADEARALDAYLSTNIHNGDPQTLPGGWVLVAAGEGDGGNEDDGQWIVTYERPSN